MQSQLSIITWVLTGIILVIVYFNFSRWKNHDVIAQDTISYYAYLPAVIIQHDPALKFIDRDPHYWGDKIWYNTTADGNRVIKMGMGMSYCYFPFFMAAHLYAQSTGQQADGYSMPYKVALVWSCFFYGMAGLYFLRKLLRVWFYDETLISIVMLLIVFGTNLYNYLTYNNPMSHTYSFALITAFIWYTEKWHRSPRMKTSVILGILAGWIFLVRPVNLLVIFIFTGYGSVSLLSLADRVRFFLAHSGRLAILTVTALITVLPQFLYWHEVTGKWMFYSYMDEHFYFNHPMIAEGLFSWRKGWLLYTPVMLLAIPGLFLLKRTVRELKLVAPLLFAAILYITFSWWCWWYGGSMGMRPLIDWYGLLALPLAAVLYRIRKNKPAYVTTLIILVGLVAYNQLQHTQYRYGSIHYDSMTREAYFYNWGRVQKRKGVDDLFHAPDYSAAKNGIREYHWE